MDGHVDRRWWQRRAVRVLGSAVVCFLMVTILVHLPTVQRLMGWTHPDGTGACPFGYGAQRLASRSVPAVTPSAAGRPALGFQLGRTTRTNVVQWAASHGVACRHQARRHTIECTSVPGSAVGGTIGGTLWFELDDADMVRAIRTARRTSNVESVASAFEVLGKDLRSTVGPPLTTSGDATAAALARGTFQQAALEFRRRDFRVVVRATNMGGGFLLTESYAAL